MRIKIAADGHQFVIPIPIMLVFNRISVGIIAKCLRKNTQFQITEEQLLLLGRELRRSTKTL